MSHWSDLPENLGPRARQLAVQLRRLKDHSGLSLTALSARTAYSRSSWDRYLNGRTLPPADAVAELARAAGADPARLLALCEVAVREREGARAAGPDEAEGSAEGAAGRAEPRRDAPAAAPRRVSGPRRPVVVAAATVAVLSALVAALLVVHSRPAAGTEKRPAVERDDGRAWAHSGPYRYRAGHTYGCTYRRIGGLLYAGHSGTRTALVVNGSGGWDAVEVQCLLRAHGVSPGMVDGAYGDLTERAVTRLQQRTGLVVDGKVGPHTWAELRR